MLCMWWKGNLSHQQRVNYDDVSQRRFKGEDSMNANSFITIKELVDTINHSPEIDRGDEMGPVAVKRGKYVMFTVPGKISEMKTINLCG